MKKLLLLALASAGLLLTLASRADSPLFSDDGVLELSIPINFKSLCRPREDPDCDFAPTVMTWTDAGGAAHEVNIELQIRGGWRAQAKNCSAPLLWVRFDPKSSADTPFEGQNTLPLTTHCGQGVTLESWSFRPRQVGWEQYLLREYLAYRLYNEVTPLSLGARLVRITYPNPDKPGREIRNYAFFSEHLASLAERSGLKWLRRGSFDPAALDGQAANRLALFQFMIGNTDWSIARERNTALMGSADGRQLPVPYDFDMSGLVDAPYAGPQPGLPIDDVRKRYFLGYCHPDTDWDGLFEDFLQRQDRMLALTAQVPGFDKTSIRSTRHFLEKFFRLVHDNKKRGERIVEHCQPWPPEDGKP